MKGIIVFKSQYGSTEQYARWLSAKTGLPMLPIQRASADRLKQYDFIVIGSNIKLGKIQASGWINRNWWLLREKEVLLFTVSCYELGSSELHETLDRSLNALQQDHLAFFPLPGRLSPDRLNWLDKFMLQLGSSIEKDPEMREKMREGFDNVQMENLDELLEAVNCLKEPAEVL